MGDSLLQMSSMSSVKVMELRDNFSAAKTPQQNGVVERKNITVQEAARTMLNEEKLSDLFWREAVYISI